MQGLFHTQVLQLLISGGETITLRAAALESTSIKTGGRRRDPFAIKLARKSGLGKSRCKARRDEKIRRKSSLFSKLSRKKATAELQQLTTGHLLLATKDTQAIRPMVAAHVSAAQTSLPEFQSDSSSLADSSTPCSPGASSSG